MRVLSFAQTKWLQKVALLALLVAALPSQAATTLQPVDTAAKDPSFLKFRTQLMNTLAKKDAKGLIAVLDKHIKVSFGGEAGVEDFKKAWGLNKPATSPVWSELGQALKMGGSFDQHKSFIAPYVASAWPENLDPFEYSAVIAKNVNIRAKPDMKGAVIKTVSYEVLPIEYSQNMQWTTIKLSNGKKGYIATQYMRSPIDYRAYFDKVNGAWKLTAFVAGD